MRSSHQTLNGNGGYVIRLIVGLKRLVICVCARGLTMSYAWDPACHSADEVQFVCSDDTTIMRQCCYDSHLTPPHLQLQQEQLLLQLQSLILPAGFSLAREDPRYTYVTRVRAYVNKP